MSLSYGDAGDSLRNRAEFLRGLGIDPGDLVCCRQAHGTTVSLVKAVDKGRGAFADADAIESCDALVTAEPGVPLGIFTADCLSIFLFDPHTCVAGIVHAGWRSTRQGIAAKTVRLMRDEFGTPPDALEAGFGPAIGACCYEVKEEFRSLFPSAMVTRGSRYYLDLVRVNTEQLVKAGVCKEHIADHGGCTSCRTGEYFSYRREGASCGRMLSVIMIR